MKIVLLIDGLGFGGAQRQIVNLAVELKRSGHEIEFLCYNGENKFYLPLLEGAGITPIVVENRNAVERLLKIRRAVKRLSPEVLISFLTTPSFCAAVASAGRHRWKHIASERNAKESTFTSRKGRIMRGVIAKFTDVIACNSMCGATLWEKHYPATKDKLTTIYNIIDVPEQECSFSTDGKCRMVVAARYERVKNLDGMLRAVKLLTPEEREKLEIHWYGKMDSSEETRSVVAQGKEYVSENGLDSCVHLHPATDKIYPIMADADYVGLFSYIEGLPNAIIEGMTLRKPVIMSTVSDYAVLVDESNGFTCDPSFDESIAEALRRAISTTAEQRARMGESSCERIGRICSREAVVAQWEALIKAN